MHDGAGRTLRNVRHVPNLRKNLISLGVLEENGCKIILENGVLKVVCGSLVVMKGVCHRNLYPLICETVTGDLAVGISGSKDQINARGYGTCALGICQIRVYHCLVGKVCLRT